ncbi:ergothioneine biosynthesis protein EgtB [Pedobacter sp. JCM 36344]|uniref:ergothioneine biosynthesis protein EgtB n=1 Tax=Pedobacter sp. JCM 36344 TaxID=3374280 RepID=UPI00397861F8
MNNLKKKYKKVREHSVAICATLEVEDYVIQPVADVSPPKWHLGHTTWFFETFILKAKQKDYKEFDPQYNYVFNSYYETIGARVVRTDRGNLSRPTVSEVFKYRKYVDEQMLSFLEKLDSDTEVAKLLELGLQHEQQHQELLASDIKYILGHNPLFPTYKAIRSSVHNSVNTGDIRFEAGIYEIGYNGFGFCFDNELGRHKTYLDKYLISNNLVTNAEYLAFITAGGYSDFRYWHAEGWDWVKKNDKISPLYWHNINGKWMYYKAEGLCEIEMNAPVCHVNFYEAFAFASWSGKRLPTEAEWEVASDHLNWGERWEWTSSAYLPYPGFVIEEGAIGEYNGKFMVSQMVLRGASEATPDGHSRKTYRNFFHPSQQWQFSGIRLVG